MKILVVEDNEHLNDALCRILEENGYDVEPTYDGKTGLNFGLQGGFDIIIMDVMMPEMNGFEVVQALRKEGVSTPILMLTARDSVPDKITGFDSGADDYMTKPFSPQELLAHLRALLRRQGTEIAVEGCKAFDLDLNLESYDLTCNGKTIHLSLKEFEITKILMQNKEHVISKETLIDKVWGEGSSAEDNNVEAYVSMVRKKLKFLGSKVQIETLRKAGYRLNEA